MTPDPENLEQTEAMAIAAETVEPPPVVDLTPLLDQIQTLTERVTKLEGQLLLIPDVDRYGQLQQALMAGDFRQADHITTTIILDALNESRDTLSPESLSKLPCTVLTVIDRLWRTYSDGRFGFGVQLGIYQQVGGGIDTLRTQDRKVMGAFAETVGWLVNGELQFPNYDHWDFSLSAPAGTFPAQWWRSPYGLKMVTFFFMRLLDCHISGE